ncbi:unnamed protein product [Tuber aestivum]|uniref:Uncharacterized protein n=1 Tax=Tuber aestivum TaxID=59557 RepID=A0A292PN77_9PEZI|nr:unnamed protein product [Tuber aestivum]
MSSNLPKDPPGNVVLVSPYQEGFFCTPDKSDESNSLAHNLAQEFQSVGFVITLLLKSRVPIMKLGLKATD